MKSRISASGNVHCKDLIWLKSNTLAFLRLITNLRFTIVDFNLALSIEGRNYSSNQLHFVTAEN